MASKSHNAKKPKLIGHNQGIPGNQVHAVVAGGEAATPEKHKMSFAQHQHELEHAAEPLPSQDVPTTQQLKSDAQQHQQKSGSHR